MINGIDSLNTDVSFPSWVYKQDTVGRSLQLQLEMSWQRFPSIPSNWKQQECLLRFQNHIWKRWFSRGVTLEKSLEIPGRFFKQVFGISGLP